MIKYFDDLPQEQQREIMDAASEALHDLLWFQGNWDKQLSQDDFVSASDDHDVVYDVAMEIYNRIVEILTSAQTNN